MDDRYGMPSHGKSAVLDTILHNLVELHGWKIAITSIENQPLERHAAQLIAIHEGLPFGEGDVPRMDAATMERGLAWLDEHFVFILPDEGGCSVGGILDCVAWTDAQGFVTQGVVIDPWNELEHKRPAGMNETEYVSQSLTRLRRFARMKEKHLWLVAHPTKLQPDVKTGEYPVPNLYHISGSAHFRNKADMGISVWRDMLNESSPTEVYIQKVRFRECGKVGKVELYFNVVSGRFDERPPHCALKNHEIIVPNSCVFSWESDVISVNKTGFISEFEIKVSRADFKADAKKERATLLVNPGARRLVWSSDNQSTP
jgi:twinkle protein